MKITDELLACAILDPNVKSSEYVQDELEKRNLTAFDLINIMFAIYKISVEDDNVQTDNGNNQAESSPQSSNRNRSKKLSQQTEETEIFGKEYFYVKKFGSFIIS